MALTLSLPLGAQTTPKGPSWLSDATFYQVYPSTFKDSDGNGIGDLQGVIDKLNYLHRLGVNAIWLSPVYLSGWKDGGYDVTDYYRIDPRFGTNADMVRLINEAHRHGIRICMDLVCGHTSTESEWFKKSAQSTDPYQQYSNYYIWTDTLDAKELQELKEGKGPWVQIDAPRGKYFRHNFSPAQPALNFGYCERDPNHPWEVSPDSAGPKACRQELRNIMAFWFELGVDAFRCDMASQMVKNDPERVETMKLWREMRDWLDREYPDKIITSEWGNSIRSIGGGFHIDFCLAWAPGYEDMFFTDASHSGYFDYAGKGKTAKFVEFYTDNYTHTRDKGYISITTSNHDMKRPCTDNRTGFDLLKVIMIYKLTMPGVPFIYYGEEIGMKHIDGLPDKEGSGLVRVGCRTPMQWDTTANAGFSTCTADRLYLPVDHNPARTVETQEGDPESLLNHTRKLVQLRHMAKALGNDGDWKMLSDTAHPYPMVYQRTYGDEQYVVVLNPSKKKVRATIAPQGTAHEVYGSGSGRYEHTAQGDKLTAGPVSAIIYKIEK